MHFGYLAIWWCECVRMRLLRRLFILYWQQPYGSSSWRVAFYILHSSIVFSHLSAVVPVRCCFKGFCSIPKCGVCVCVMLLPPDISMDRPNGHSFLPLLLLLLIFFLSLSLSLRCTNILCFLLKKNLHVSPVNLPPFWQRIEAQRGFDIHIRPHRYRGICTSIYLYSYIDVSESHTNCALACI